MAFHFTAHCSGSDPLNIREQLERFANEQWLPEHATMEEATEIVLDQFKRTVTQALATLELRCTRYDALLSRADQFDLF